MKPRVKSTTEQIYTFYPFKASAKQLSVYYIKERDVNRSSKYSLTYKDYKAIIDSYFELLLEDLFTQAKAALPRLGRIVLEKFKGKVTNYHSSKVQKKSVNHLNLHTSGYIVRVNWIKEGRDIIPFKNRKYVKFRLLKKYKASLSQVIKNTNLIDKIYL